MLHYSTIVISSIRFLQPPNFSDDEQHVANIYGNTTLEVVVEVDVTGR